MMVVVVMMMMMMMMMMRIDGYDDDDDDNDGLVPVPALPVKPLTNSRRRSVSCTYSD